jgi:cytochrome o ubiquinol oxidase subunit 1
MPKNTASGIYISIFAFFMGFGFVWHITWMVIVSILGVIFFSITRTFNEHTEYTLTAAEVKKLDEARIKKMEALKPIKDTGPEDDMGLREFIKVVLVWAWSIVKSGKWRVWQKQ